MAARFASERPMACQQWLVEANMAWQHDHGMVEPPSDILPSKSHFHPRQAPASLLSGISCLAGHVHVSSQFARGLGADSAGAQGMLKWHVSGIEPRRRAVMTRHARGAKLGEKGKMGWRTRRRGGEQGGQTHSKKPRIIFEMASMPLWPPTVVEP